MRYGYELLEDRCFSDYDYEDVLYDKAFSEGYEYAQREFGILSSLGISAGANFAYDTGRKYGTRGVTKTLVTNLGRGVKGIATGNTGEVKKAWNGSVNRVKAIPRQTKRNYELVKYDEQMNDLRENFINTGKIDETELKKLVQKHKKYEGLRDSKAFKQSGRNKHYFTI